MKEFPEIFNTQIFNKMITIAEYSKMSVNDKLRYDQARKSELDTRIIMNEYKEQFLEQGRLNKAKQFITTLLKTGNFSIEEIVSLTGESKELVLMVKNEL